MICLVLFWEFLKIGMFSFGGAYGAIPLIRESVAAQGWLTEEGFADMAALSESTPGPIMVNAATYIGAVQAGIPGAAAATLGVILPAFFIILLVTKFMSRRLGQKGVQAAMRGIRPCLAGVIFATGLHMAFNVVCGRVEDISFDGDSFIVFVILIVISGMFLKMRKKEISPILLIVISAVLGIVIL